MNIKKLVMTVITMLAIAATGTCFAISKEDFVIGNIYFGQPLKEVIAKYGQPVAQELSNEYPRYYFVKEGESKWFLVDTKPDDDKSIVSVAINGDINLATKAGIKIGSTAAEMKKAYGEPNACLDSKNNPVSMDDKNYQYPCIVNYEADGWSLQFILVWGKDGKEREVISMAMRVKV